MLFPESSRVKYKNNPLIEVVLQLRFPTILSIDVNEPNEFQDLIRNCFPIYNLSIEQTQQLLINPQQYSHILPQIINGSGNKNHCFESADGNWRINLTSNFIALTTGAYVCWEDFIKHFTEPFQYFITCYKPAFFNRIGLRYIDAINRANLNLSEAKWKELINPFLLGVLAEEDISENAIISYNNNTEIKLDSNDSFLRLHTGLGHVNNDPETQFIIDSDIYCSTATPNDEAINVANDLHGYSTKLIRGSITDKLHYAMEPEDL